MRALIAMGDHAIVKLFDAIPAGAYKQKRENRMHQAGEPGANHLHAEAKSAAHMLKIGLANAGGMFCEGALDHGLLGPLLTVSL